MPGLLDIASGTHPGMGLLAPIQGQSPLGLRMKPFAKPPMWLIGEEQAFRNWMAKQAASAGTHPNPDEYLHAYRYRDMYRNREEQSIDPEDGLLHGSSKYKEPYHPNRFVIDNGRLIDSISGSPAGIMDVLRLLSGS